VRFGISTHLFHDQRLRREHLEKVAGHGFETIELFATRTHFDYHDPRAIDALAGWLLDLGLELHSLHAPIVDSFRGGAWGTPYSSAHAELAVRQRWVDETSAALGVARRIPMRFLVLHLGIPDTQGPAPNDNSRDAARRSLESIDAIAAPLRVQVAVEVIPNKLSAAATLVKMIEDELELQSAGICLDFGHARLMEDLLDAIEECSGHLVTTHVHDNRGKVDDHLVPFEGTIDWPVALMAVQKIGYEGVLLFEVANTGNADEVLLRSEAARRRFETILGEP
jgi:sugar phosphate isomerase/epimerase